MEMSAAVVHRALDGVRFSYQGDVDLSHPATSIANVVVGGVVREFTSAPLWGADLIISRSGVLLDQQFTCQGGVLRIGRTAQEDLGGKQMEWVLRAVWYGQRYALLTHLYNASATAALALIDAVRITEHADGLVIAPRQEARAAFQEPACTAKWIPSLGHVDAKPLDKKATRALPSWRGAAVQGGELFRDTLSNGNPYLVLATPTALVTIIPPPAHSLTQVATLAGGLTVRASA